MKELFIYAAGVVVCSGFFTLFYRFALHGRTSFRVARVFLVASLAAAIIIPALRIPVWKAPEPLNLTMLPIEWATVEETEASATAKKRDLLPLAVWAVYAAGVGAILISAARQMASMRRIRSRGKTYAADGYSLVVSEGVESPFSFFSTVYAGAATPPEELRQIIAHEAGHIRRKHSAEKMIMEALKTAVWFNPFGWMAARLLNEVHEFEADRDALCRGCGREEYMLTIFRQAFGYVPEISAGLGHSLTKKRFEMMMKNFKHARFSWLRTAGVLPLAAAMLMLFGFTRRAPEIVLRTETAHAADSPEQKTISSGTGSEGNPEVNVIGARAVRASGSSEAGTIINGGQADIFIWDAVGNRRITVEEMGRMKPEEITSVSIWKGGNIPEDVRQMIGDRDVKEVIVINSEKDSSADGAETLLGSLIVRKDGAASGGRPFVWISGTNPHEIKYGDMDKINPYMVASISVLKHGRDSYPEEIIKAMGDRSFDGVIIIEPKKEGNESGAVESETAEQAVSTESGDPFIWIAGTDPHEFKGTKDQIDPNSIKSISVFKNKNSFPEEIRKAIGDREFDEVIIIEPKKEQGESVTQTDEPDKMPSFPGGQPELAKWLNDNIQYPPEAVKQNIGGRVIARFTVKADGSLDNIEILQSPHELLSEEVIRLVKAMPDWIPGEKDGKPVNVSFNLPVVFGLSGK